MLKSKDFPHDSSAPKGGGPLVGAQCRERGQGAVEFVVSAAAILLLLLGGVQLAVILNAALAVNQYTYSAARYASIHCGGSSPATCKSTISGNVAPSASICTSGFTGCGGGAGLTLETPTCSGACTGGNITSGDQITVIVQYNVSTGHKLGVPNPFFGYTFPTLIQQQTSMMAE